MIFDRIDPARGDQVEAAVALAEVARRVDDPDRWPLLPAVLTDDLRHGYDLRPAEQFLGYADGKDPVVDQPVGLVTLDQPSWDNHHLVAAEITVHPEHRRHGHGRAMLREVERRRVQVGRTTTWIWAPGAGGGAAFATGRGFVASSRDARRRQVLAPLDRARLDQLRADARPAGEDYELVRIRPPLDDDQLSELAEVAAAINDAPMGGLAYEPERFGLDRMRDGQRARAARNERIYRVLARHRASGRLAGHTELIQHPAEPHHGYQGDTAVARAHRGHRLGLLLKLEMLDWLADVAPEIEVIETWNNVDNDPMIRVNEALGYQLSTIHTTYQRVAAD